MAPRPTCGVALPARGRERLGGAGGALAGRPRSPHCAPRARTMSPREPRRAGPGCASPPAGNGGVYSGGSPPPPTPTPPVLVLLLLLLLAQEFLNFKEQVTSTCLPLSLGHRAWPPKSRAAASRRLASALPPSAPRRASGERERERKGAFMRTTKLQIWLPSLSCLITAKK